MIMGIRDWPIWVRTFGIISIATIVLVPLIIILVMGRSFMKEEGVLVTLFFILPLIGIIVGFWIFGFLFSYLKKHNLSIMANIIASILLIVSAGFSFWFTSMILSDGFQLILLVPGLITIYFIIALIMINKN